VTLSNAVPTLNLPLAVVGSNDRGLPLGTNRIWFNFYTPLVLRNATVDGKPTPFSSEKEFGLRVFGDVLDIPPGKSVKIVLDLGGQLALHGRYTVVSANQPLVNPDDMHVVVIPKNGRFEPTNSTLAVDASGTAASTDLTGDRRAVLLAVRFKQGAER
jgi:hypothetical protein